MHDLHVVLTSFLHCHRLSIIFETHFIGGHRCTDYLLTVVELLFNEGESTRQYMQCTIYNVLRAVNKTNIKSKPTCKHKQ